MSRPRIVCLVGPTASGKTSLGLEIAEAVGGEIVSADSRQVYRGMDVGTAKPTGAERRRVPHHGLDLVDPEEDFDVARFRDAAAAALGDVQRRGRAALVVGGTGLWIRVLLRGLCPAPPRDARLRRALRALAAARGVPELHRHLAALDPASAGRIHPNDLVRLERALEVAFTSGRRLSEWQRGHRFGEQPYEALVIGMAVAPPVLAARIAARARDMMTRGFADEVRALVARGVPDGAAAWRSVGYPEMRAHVEGRIDGATALEQTIVATRRFARRQRTWFRRDTDVVWRDPALDRGRVLAEAAAFLRDGVRPAGCGNAQIANSPAPR